MSLIIASYIGIFCLGYIVARLNDILGKLKKSKMAIDDPHTVSAEEYAALIKLLDNPPLAPDWFREAVHKKEELPAQNKPIQIDERLFITEMKTDTLEKKYDSSKLGETTTETDTNFSSSISKLASLKKKNES